jgi:hypothetical protein
MHDTNPFLRLSKPRFFYTESIEYITLFNFLVNLSINSIGKVKGNSFKKRVPRKLETDVAA